MSVSLLFFASDYKIGLSSLLTDQLISLSQQKELKICAIAGDKEQEEGLNILLQRHRIDIKRVEGLDDHRYFRRLAELLAIIISDLQIKVVHVQNNWQLCLIVFAKYIIGFRKRRIKIIYTLHGFRHNNKLKSLFARIIIGVLLMLFADRIIYMSDYVRRKFRFLSRKMVQIYIGVDDIFFNKVQNNICTDKLKLIFPAQFRHGKNQFSLIDAFAIYCKDKKDSAAELYLPGDGYLKQKCQQLAIKREISDQVFFPGLLNKRDIKNLYDSCNIGVIPSNSETYGQCIVEPFVLGRCVITRRVGVATDIIKEGENGFFFKNTREITDILTMLSKDSRIIKKVGTNNFSKRELFSWENSTRKYLSLINALLRS